MSLVTKSRLLSFAFHPGDKRYMIGSFVYLKVCVHRVSLNVFLSHDIHLIFFMGILSWRLIFILIIYPIVQAYNQSQARLALTFDSSFFIVKTLLKVGELVAFLSHKSPSHPATCSKLKIVAPFLFSPLFSTLFCLLWLCLPTKDWL